MRVAPTNAAVGTLNKQEDCVIQGKKKCIFFFKTYRLLSFAK